MKTININKIWCTLNYCAKFTYIFGRIILFEALELGTQQIYNNLFKLFQTFTVGENSIAPTKIRINHYAIQPSVFSIAPCKVITLNPHSILFGISSLLLL